MTSAKVMDVVTRSILNGKVNGRAEGKNGKDIRYYIKFNREEEKWGVVLREQSRGSHPTLTKIEARDLISLMRILLLA